MNITFETINEILSVYLKQNYSEVTNISLGTSSHYNPENDEIKIEERLFEKSKILSLYVALHEAVHAYQEDRIFHSYSVTYILSFMRKFLHYSFLLTFTLLYLALIFPQLLYWVIGLIVVATLIVLWREFEASYNAVRYLNENYTVYEEKAIRYLRLAWYTYLNKSLGNIFIALSLLAELSWNNLFITSVFVVLISIIISLQISRRLSIIEYQLSDEVYGIEGDHENMNK
ncbi:zinc metallopeptidase [Patescibacteria group bacterium]|nr:zinc metallopeptidase [Patescibacteria group bacterium]